MGLGGAVRLALPTEARSGEPAGGRRERSTGDTKEHATKGPVNLVGMASQGDIEQVRDVLRARASTVRSCESRVPRTRGGTIKSPPTRGLGGRGCQRSGPSWECACPPSAPPQRQSSPSRMTPDQRWPSGTLPVQPCFVHDRLC